MKVLEHFKSKDNQKHNELMGNISRILSRVSSDSACSYDIIQTNKLSFLTEMIEEFKMSTFFVERVAFVLANLATYFDEARAQLSTKDSIKRLFDTALYYFEMEKTEKLEGTLAKFVRLVANLWIDGQHVDTLVQGCGKPLLQRFMVEMMASMERKQLAQSAEFIVFSVSCTTNILFFDTPQQELFDHAQRMTVFRAVKPFVLETTNEEL